MKRIGLTLVLSCCLSALFAQVKDSSLHKPDTSNGGHVFNMVEREAHFPGGDSAWGVYCTQAVLAKAKFLKRNNGYGRIEAQYLIMSDGRVDSVKLVKPSGTALDGVVIELLKNAPKWVPAYQRGHNVKAYRRQKFTYVQ